MIGIATQPHAEQSLGIMKAIHYIKGDATMPTGVGNKIIVHVCNDIGGWGAGFVLAVSARWKAPELRYRAWFRDKGIEDPPFGLGAVQFVDVEPGVAVGNLIGQHGIRSSGGSPPIRYEAIRQGLEEVAVEAVKRNASVHMPRIGCGLAGGKWEEIEVIIQTTLIEPGIAVTVYDLAKP
jgi:O-acetyl-ADP-ribose deacetylase (regulator of RNase III)